MQRSHVVAYLCLPLLWAVIGFAEGLRYEPLVLGTVTSYLVGGFLFYAAPFFAWAAVTAALRPVKWIWHAGFISALLALGVASALSIWGPRDPSGLPYAWLTYWPLAGIGMAAVLVTWWVTGHRRAGV